MEQHTNTWYGLQHNIIEIGTLSFLFFKFHSHLLKKMAFYLDFRKAKYIHLHKIMNQFCSDKSWNLYDLKNSFSSDQNEMGLKNNTCIFPSCILIHDNCGSCGIKNNADDMKNVSFLHLWSLLLLQYGFTTSLQNHPKKIIKR